MDRQGVKVRGDLDLWRSTRTRGGLFAQFENGWRKWDPTITGGFKVEF